MFKSLTLVCFITIVTATTNKDQLVHALKKYVRHKHNNDFELAFKEFDTNADKHIDRVELKGILYKIGIGTLFTRGKWVNGIIDLMDIHPRDDLLSFDELVIASFDEASNKVFK